LQDGLTFIVFSAFDRKIYVGLLAIKPPARLTDFSDSDRPDGSWYYEWDRPDKSWASKNIGPEVDLSSMRGLGPEAWLDDRIGRGLNGNFLGLFLRCGALACSYSKADEPRFTKYSNEAEYRPNGATAIQLEIPGWLLWSVCAAGFAPLTLRSFKKLRSYRRRIGQRCPKCNYDLRATLVRWPEGGLETGNETE